MYSGNSIAFRGLLSITLALTSTCMSTTLAESDCTLYVDSKRGNDLNGGLSKSSAKRTLGAVQLVVKTLPGTSDVVVCLAAGSIFRETLQLQYDVRSTNEPKSVVWRSYGVGDNARITGGVDVTFEPLPQADPARLILPPSVADAVVIASLVAAGVNASQEFPFNGGFEWGCHTPFPAFLIFNGSSQQVARWPNAGQGEFGGSFANTAPVNPHNSYESSTDGLLVGEPNVPWSSWVDTMQLTAHGYWLVVVWGGLEAT